MPPKDKFFNRHAAEAREREDERTNNARNAKTKAAEDAKWAEDDKKVLKKASQAQDQAAKEAEAERRRQEKKQQQEEEDRTLSQGPTKITKKQMQRDVAKLFHNYNADVAKVRGDTTVVTNQTPLPTGNVNTSASAADNTDNHIVASGISASVTALENSNKRGGGGAARMHMPTSIADRHIGKRARVAFKQFQTDNMQRLKEEKPNMRITQYNDMLWERWQKSPLNPFVQRAEARSADVAERERTWMFAEDDEVSDSEAQ